MGLGDIVGVLELATREEKDALYPLLGLELTYMRTGRRSEHLNAALRPRVEPLVSEGGLGKNSTPDPGDGSLASAAVSRCAFSPLTRESGSFSMTALALHSSDQEAISPLLRPRP